MMPDVQHVAEPLDGEYRQLIHQSSDKVVVVEKSKRSNLAEKR